MKSILKFEEAAMFALCLFALSRMDAAWWWYLLLLIGPDIGMVGYLAGNRAGALTYNLLHHKGIAVAVFFAGWMWQDVWLQQAGMVLFGHSSMDRMLGFGLKYATGFKYTHLGEIGKKP